MAHSRLYFHVSSSLGNWREKIRKRYQLPEYKWWRDWNKSVIFFGLYRPSDYLKFFLHRGEKTVIWCGSDIILGGRLFHLVKRFKARHICENRLEQRILSMLLGGIEPEVRPQFFNDFSKYPISYKPSPRPHVWLCIHEGHGAERQGGLHILGNIASRLPEITFHVYGLGWPEYLCLESCPNNVLVHGMVSEEQMDKEIQDYQCGLRLHEFDGFSEVTAKSILMGQYPITRIPFPHIDSYRNTDELIGLLRALKDKKEPNYQAGEWWYKELSRPL